MIEFESWKFWVIIYLISAVLFAQVFKKTNRQMKNSCLLTVLLELFTELFDIMLILMFEIKISTNPTTYIILFIVCIIYAMTDRLNIEARYGLDPSVFSMLKQMSSVFIIILGIILFNEKIVINKLLGAVIIILANFLLAFKKSKIEINKYFIMSLLSNFLFAVGMIINVNISKEFNIAFYTFMTVFIPALIIILVGRYKYIDLKKEFKQYNKQRFLFTAAMWCLMLISSVKAYEYGNVVIVASLVSLTALLNSIIEFFFDKDRKKLVKKILVYILIIIGIILIKS